jgi:hypothetical protein
MVAAGVMAWIVLLMLVLRGPPSLETLPFFGLVMLAAAELWVRSAWPRMMIGALLLLFGAGFVWILVNVLSAGVTRNVVLPLAVSVAAITSGSALMFSPSVGVFLRDRRVASTSPAARLLRWSWILFAAIGGGLILFDIQRNFVP